MNKKILILVLAVLLLPFKSFSQKKIQKINVKIETLEKRFSNLSSQVDTWMVKGNDLLLNAESFNSYLKNNDSATIAQDANGVMWGKTLSAMLSEGFLEIVVKQHRKSLDSLLDESRDLYQSMKKYPDILKNNSQWNNFLKKYTAIYWETKLKIEELNKLASKHEILIIQTIQVLNKIDPEP